jgi:hypothetical protein
MKHTFAIVLALALVALAFALYWLNRMAVDLAASEFFGALFTGLKILFFAGVALGVAWCAVELKRHSQVKVIRPNKHGAAQVLIHNGEVHHLAQPNSQAQLDPLQQMALLQKFIQVQGQMGKFTQQTHVQEVKPLEIEAPAEQIGAIVKYEDIRDEVPDDMSLLGIHPSDGALEFSSWEKLKMLWIVGSSSTGKSNTVFGKALEAYNHGAKLLVIDQHAVKPDSLARKLEPLKAAFLRPIATTDDQVLSTLRDFKTEFERRVAGASCELKIVLIMDEVNRMARNEALLGAIKEIVAIGGEESRGFGMYVWAISQKGVWLKWLRDSAITVIAHRVTSMEEAKLVCNEDLKAARQLLKFPVGRSFVYGVDFEGMIELQQPLYEVPEVIESTIEPLPQNFHTQQSEANEEAPGSAHNVDTGTYDLSTIKILREIGKRLKAGDSKADIVKSFGLPYGRATQEMGAVVDMVASELEVEEA